MTTEQMQNDSGGYSGNGFIMQPGRNCWRIETAGRASCLVDGEAYFTAAKQALLKARHSIQILGWNFAEQARLQPGQSDPHWPDEIGALLETLADEREGLSVHVLAWDKTPALALGRRELPGAQAADMNSGRVRYRLDAAHPALASHHQKVLVVDDAVAFCGGFDLAANRWDTRDHLPEEPRRRMPTGQPYEAHHDVMLAVDGDAARALGDLARERWRLATGEPLAPTPPNPDAWPEDTIPDFHDVPVGIVRTAPAWRDRPEIREAEALFLDSIAAARDSIYVESQYFAAPRIADAMAARLKEADGPDIVVVNPKRAPSATEQVAMDTARTRMLHDLQKADKHGRFRLFAAVNGDEEIVVHSKVMVVDDALLRIGSANMNNRSMGVDTECDLAIEAARAPDASRVRGQIVDVRNDLLAEHLGVSADVFSATLTEEGSLVSAIDALNGTSRRRLAHFDEPRPNRLVPVEHNALLDPYKPLGRWWKPSRPGIFLASAAIASLAGLALIARIRKSSRYRT
ncbi:phospholipase D-like domain-containing protein [Citreimonas salinaria]|uniref:Phospholipase D n=1 Tax=Citreimonas salinaria TaxID=321339 RepID=A0A1H3KNT0_9RHOB|nr:phospholipase D-like domain-containing protein [Citreimonas salinaria]SDY53706.1 Phosphatidylserine/phosphatidylglycerophosphate/cardiolipin synthase [Citreimonas salinaria]